MGEALNRIITYQDLREFDVQNLWELTNPKFAQAPAGSDETLPQFKRRQRGGPLRGLTNYITPSRLYGIRKILAWPFWVFVITLIAATATAYEEGRFNMGQVYVTLGFFIFYLLLFIKAGKSRIQKWEKIYTRKIKTDTGTHTPPAIIFDGRDMLLANERIFEMLGARPIAAFVDDYEDQLRYKKKTQAAAQKQADKDRARIKKQREDEEFKGAVKGLGALAASGLATAAKAPKTQARSNNARSSAPSTPNYVKIEGYTGTYWETCASGLDNNSNYISIRLQQIRKSNPRYIKLRAVDSKGRVVDMG